MEDGELELRHDVSSDSSAVKRSVQPPERPLESVIRKNRSVPPAMFAFQM